MLKKETKDSLVALGFDVDKLVEAAIHAVEQDFTMPEIKNYSDADLAVRDENSKKEGKKEGKKDGIAIATKVIADKFGITDADLSKPDSIVEKLMDLTKGESTLKDQIKKLQDDKVTLLAEKETAVGAVKSAMFDRDIITKFPANRTKLMNDAELLSLVKGNLAFEEVEGITLVKKNGEILRDATTKNPLPLEAAINSLFTERNWVEASANGGRGGGDRLNNGGGMKKYSQVEDAWVAEGKNVMSPEFHAHLQKIAKATTDFDMNG
jgi:hypothetical protein